MADNHDAFDGRLQRIGKKHRQMAHGYELYIQADGLIVARPRRFRGPVPARSFVTFVAGLLLFKGILIASLGPLAYDERVTTLRGGTILEQAGAMIMVSDPVSRDIGGFLAPVFR